MVQVQTLFRISDNSGARKAKCIKILGGFKRRRAVVGDLIVVSIQRVKQHKKKKIKIKEGQVCRGIIIRTKSNLCRKNSSFFHNQENSLVVLNAAKKPLATRVLGPVPKKFRYSKYMKIASLSSGFF